jgi:hypothetical protein
LAFATIAAGVLIVAFGLYVQAPLGPSAIWTGILDSAQTSPSALPDADVSSLPTTTIALYFRNARGSHFLRLPPRFAAVANSIQAGDTLQVVVGWARRQETPLALGIIQNGAVLLDTAVVLQAQRQRSFRTVIGGTLIGLLGVIGIIVRKRGAAPTPAGLT